jgi:ArsR family transcriptional regulator, arsenate/arsenite/antimonite-responsive transcriptional repressor
LLGKVSLKVARTAHLHFALWFTIEVAYFYLLSESMQTPEATTTDLIGIGFHALSEPLRIKVLELLRQQELCVCDLCNALGVSQSKLSFHLKTLKEAGLVRARQEGRWIYYSLNVSQFAVLEEYLAEYSRLVQITPACPCCE